MYYHLARSRFIYYLLAHSFIVTLTKIVKKARKALRRRATQPKIKFSKDVKLPFFNCAVPRFFGLYRYVTARMFRSLIPVLMIKERNILARNITI